MMVALGTGGSLKVGPGLLVGTGGAVRPWVGGTGFGVGLVLVGGGLVGMLFFEGVTDGFRVGGRRVCVGIGFRVGLGDGFREGVGFLEGLAVGLRDGVGFREGLAVGLRDGVGFREELAVGLREGVGFREGLAVGLREGVGFREGLAVGL